MRTPDDDRTRARDLHASALPADDALVAMRRAMELDAGARRPRREISELSNRRRRAGPHLPGGARTRRA